MLALSRSKKIISVTNENIIKTPSDFDCLGCLHSFAVKTNINLMKKSKNKDFCGIVMPSKKNKAMQFNQHMKSDKVSWIIYADPENLIKKNVDVQTTSKNLH